MEGSNDKKKGLCLGKSLFFCFPELKMVLFSYLFQRFKH